MKSYSAVSFFTDIPPRILSEVPDKYVRLPFQSRCHYLLQLPVTG